MALPAGLAALLAGDFADSDAIIGVDGGEVEEKLDVSGVDPELCAAMTAAAATRDFDVFTSHLTATLDVEVAQDRKFTIEQQRKLVGVPGVTGSTVWDSAVVLAGALLRQPHTVADRVVCELGAGTGVVALAAAACNAKLVVATDLALHMACLNQNLEANMPVERVTTRIKAMEFDWSAEPSPELRSNGPYDVVLASDCVYKTSDDRLLLQALASVPMTAAGKVFMAIEVRDLRRIFSFIRAAQHAGWSVIQSPELANRHLTTGATLILELKRSTECPCVEHECHATHHAIGT